LWWRVLKRCGVCDEAVTATRHGLNELRGFSVVA
jgi:hypothetical protein